MPENVDNMTFLRNILESIMQDRLVTGAKIGPEFTDSVYPPKARLQNSRLDILYWHSTSLGGDLAETIKITDNYTKEIAEIEGFDCGSEVDWKRNEIKQPDVGEESAPLCRICEQVHNALYRSPL